MKHNLRWIVFLLAVSILPGILGDVVTTCTPTTVDYGETVMCTLSFDPKVINSGSIPGFAIDFTVQPSSSILSISAVASPNFMSYVPSTGHVEIITSQDSVSTIATITLAAGNTPGSGNLILTGMQVSETIMGANNIPQEHSVRFGTVQTTPTITVQAETAAQTCGNNVREGTEECDGTDLDGRTCEDVSSLRSGVLRCTSDCYYDILECEAICGNGDVEIGYGSADETCDDSNTENGDGCSSTCVIESGFTCTGIVSSVCTPSTATTVCGNGVIEGLEQCDTGSVSSSEGCVNCVITSSYTCTGEPSMCSQFNAGDLQMCPIGMIAWYTADNNYNDVVGNHNGLPSGNIPFGSGMIGPAFYFEPTEESFISLSELPVNTASGGKNTVEFWMHWNGQLGVMPFSWGSSYDLLFSGACFGFNTGRSDSSGVYSSSLEQGWHHIVAIFTNNPANLETENELWIDGTKSAYECGYAPSGHYSRAATTNAQISGWPASTQDYHFDGYIDDLAIYNRALTQSEIQAIFNAGSAGKCSATAVSAACDATTAVGLSTPLSLDCVIENIQTILLDTVQYNSRSSRLVAIAHELSRFFS